MKCIYEFALSKIQQMLRDEVRTMTDYDGSKVALSVSRGTYYRIKNKECSIGTVLNVLGLLGVEFEIIIDEKKYK